MRKKKFVQVTDVRDGLFQNFRESFGILAFHNEYRKSLDVTREIAEAIKVNHEEVYDTFIDATEPRATIPIIDGHGNFGFPPADMRFTEIKPDVSFNARIKDCKSPFKLPFPLLLINGSMGYSNSKTKLPPHHFVAILDATMALIKNPDLTTEDLLNYVKGPALPIGGEIDNPESLPEIYEKGHGTIKIKLSEHADADEAKDYCNWYGLKFKNMIIHLKYKAFLSDGEKEKYMSLKEIIQNYLNYIREDLSDNDLLTILNEEKENFLVREEKLSEFQRNFEALWNNISL